LEAVIYKHSLPAYSSRVAHSSLFSLDYVGKSLELRSLEIRSAVVDCLKVKAMKAGELEEI